MPSIGMDRQKYLNQKFGGSKQASKIYDAISDAGKQVGIFFQFNRIKRTPNSFASHRLLEFGHKKKKQNQNILIASFELGSTQQKYNQSPKKIIRK